MRRQQEQMILRLWRDWCKLWPEQYGHESLQVKAGGYDPVFDVIPSQAYKDFYYEVVRGHPQLRHLNAFEIVDAALNQTPSPEATMVNARQRDAVVDVDMPMEEPAVAGTGGDREKGAA